jgi:hypothetical protein
LADPSEDRRWVLPVTPNAPHHSDLVGKLNVPRPPDNSLFCSSPLRCKGDPFRLPLQRVASAMRMRAPPTHLSVTLAPKPSSYHTTSTRPSQTPPHRSHPSPYDLSHRGDRSQPIRSPPHPATARAQWTERSIERPGGRPGARRGDAGGECEGTGKTVAGPRTGQPILLRRHEATPPISTTLTPSSDNAAPLGNHRCRAGKHRSGVLSECAALQAMHSSPTHVPPTPCSAYPC